jgi:hypothetical protein
MVETDVMRRSEKELKDLYLIEEVLRDEKIGRLSMCYKDKPYVIPINFAYDKEKIYIHTPKEGKKIRYLKNNPNVCFEVDSGEMVEDDSPCSFSFDYTSVLVYGEARLVEEPSAKFEGLKIISEKYAPGKGDILDLELVQKFKDLILIEIEIERITGKKSPI